jgi:hypothetical protein
MANTTVDNKPSDNDPKDRADATGEGRDKPGTVEEATANPGEKRSTSTAAKKSTPAKKDLAPASESQDPAVHQLLAERDIAQQNKDKTAEKNATDELAKLGFE